MMDDKKFKILLTVLCVLLVVSVCYNAYRLYKEKDLVDMELVHDMQHELEENNMELQRDNNAKAERVAQLQSTLNEIEKSSTYGENQLQSKHKKLLITCDSLRKIINERDLEISTLREQEVSTPEEQENSAPKEPENKKQQTEADKKEGPTTGNATPKSAPVSKDAAEALDDAINSLKKLNELSGTDLSIVSMKEQNSINAAKKALKKFDKLTNKAYHDNIEGYLHEMDSTDFNPSLNVVSEDDGYKVKKKARKKALNMADELQKLQKNITK